MLSDEQADQARQLVKMALRAFKNNRPLFILVQYNHEADKLEFINTVLKLAEPYNLITRRYDPLNNQDHGASKLYPLLEKDATDGILSLVTAMAREQDSDKLQRDFLSYMNLHRDRIAHNKIRFVLFVRESEMADFIAGASDLWSFCHRTFWLERVLESSSDMLWQRVGEWQETLTLTDEEKLEIQEHVEVTMRLVDETSGKKDQAQLLLELTRWLIRHKQMAIEVALRGVSLLEGDNCELMGGLESELGELLRKGGNYPEALNHHKIALHISRQLNNKDLEASSLNNIALVAVAQGEFDIALKLFNKSFTLAQSFDSKEGVIFILNNLSQIYAVKGDDETALKYLYESLHTAKEHGYKAIEGIALNNIALIYLAEKKFDAALVNLQQARDIQEAIGDTESLCRTLNNISRVYEAKAELDKALEYLGDGLAIAKNVGEQATEAIICNNISLIYSAKGEFDTAFFYLKKALRIQQYIDDKVGLCGTLFNMGNIHWQNKQQKEALSVWLRVYQIAKPMEYKQALDALSGLSETIGFPPGLEGWEQLDQQNKENPEDQL
jgi:tetratricopeptide (TPR) repeat protein